MNILYVTTISNTVNAFLIPHIKMLIDEGHKVDVAFHIEQEVNPKIKEMGCTIHQLPLQRAPLSKDNLTAYKMLKKIIMINQYDLVHTHTPVASAIVRLACKHLTHIKILYTAHGFHFYKGASLINWLVYYSIEKLLARHTDVLITINKEDYKRAKHNLKAKKVVYIPGVGIDIEKFEDLKMDKTLKREEIGVPKDAFLLLSVGELNKNKNHEVVIRALAEIKNNNMHYAICGKGPLDEYLKKLSRELGLENRVHLLGFRKDIPEICKAADVFVFPSFREGLPVALMEAMVLKLPIICSDIRGNSDLIENGEGGFLFKPSAIYSLVNLINKLYLDHKLGKAFTVVNSNKIIAFSQKCVLEKIKKLYM